MGRHPDPNIGRLSPRDVYVRRPAISSLAGVAHSRVSEWIRSGELRPAQLVRPGVGRGGMLILYRLDDVLRLKNGRR